MMVTTTFSFDGYRVRECKGVVRGISSGSATEVLCYGSAVVVERGA
jgi:uncharacterized protein YbjQ (UPF0145 family)